MNNNILESTRLIRIVKNINGSKNHRYSYQDFVLETFYTFGYFDKLMYIKPKNEKYLSYKNCLGIEYPNKKENVLSEQLFCLYGGKDYEQNYDVFEYQNEDKPFLGIILVSINKTSEKNFASLTDKIAKSFINILKDETFLSGTYRTLNCADLCVVLRTSSLEDIYLTFAALKQYLDKEEIESNLTTFQCISKNVKTLNASLYQYNKNIEFDLRVTNIDEYEQRGYDCKGVLGIGSNVIRVPFKEYFEKIFPMFIDNRFYNNSNPVDIIHERIFFNNHTLNSNNYLSPNFCMDKKRRYIDALRQEVESIENKVKNIPFGKYQIEEDLLLIHELINTFCDLWYQFTSVNGYIFYVQCCLLFDGIKKNLDNIQNANTDENKMRFCKILKTNGKKAINCINNYNKILQYLNQNSVNFPTHEMQAKVNTEKYLLAYTAYLHNICNEFYNQYDRDEKEKRRKILPIALFDTNEKAISAITLFDKEPEEYTQERMSLYAVVFPNYSRFANIRHVIPLLTHELSHEFRYLKRKERNKAIVEYLLEDLAVKIVRELLRESEIKTLTINGLQTFITRILFEVLNEVILGDDNLFCGWHMYEIPDKLKNLIDEQLLSFTDRTSERIIYNTNKDSLLSLNSNIAGNHIEELYNWIYFKKQQFVDDHQVEQMKRYKTNADIKKIELLIAKMKSGKEIIDQRKIIAEYSILHKVINDILKISYENLYVDFCNYVNTVIGFSYDEVKFSNSKLILTQIHNFYKDRVLSDKNQDNKDEIIKFCEEIIDITLRLNIIGTAFPIHKTSTTQVDSNLEKIFNHLHKKVEEECCSVDSEYHIFFRSSKYRNIFNTMGLYNEQKDVFVVLLKKVLYRISGQIHNSFVEKIACYGEICADLGMCAAFNFSPFGYVRFLTNIFEKEKFETWVKGQSKTSDRINAVVTTLLRYQACKISPLDGTDAEQNFNDLKREFCIKLYEYVNQNFVVNENKANKFYEKINENIDFMKNYMNRINIFEIQYSDNGIQEHFDTLYKEINEANWVKNCKAEITLNAIGEYYNANKITEQQEKQYCTFFEHHINFVFKYYCKHREVYNRLINAINSQDDVLSLGQCMKILFEDEGGRQN